VDIYRVDWEGVDAGVCEVVVGVVDVVGVVLSELCGSGSNPIGV